MRNTILYKVSPTQLFHNRTQTYLEKAGKQVKIPRKI